MKVSYLLLISFLIVGTFCIPAVSADICYDEDITYYTDSSSKKNEVFTGFDRSDLLPNHLVFTDITAYQTLSYIIVDYNGHFQPQMDTGRHEFEYDFNGQTRPGVVYKSVNTNLLGTITSTRLTIFLNEWDIGNLSGTQCIKLPFITQNQKTYIILPGDPPHTVYLASVNSGGARISGLKAHYTVASATFWKNHILIENTSAPEGYDGYEITLSRTVDGTAYTSTIKIFKDDIAVNTNFGHGTEFNTWYPSEDIDKVVVISPFDTTYTYLLTGTTDPGDPGDPGDSTTLTVYIKNSQTGALIANSNIVIDALVNNEYYPVVNRSEPTGIFSINLQPTGGGPPNPDGYRLIVTADGYNNPMPEINFTVDDYKQSIYCLLDPIAGGPADENKTFIDFFVSDMYANPVSGATVKFGKYTLITNSAGYTVFEVPKNDYYTYTVSKSGYNTITGNANIGDAPRNTINTYLTPVTTPTTPTHIPTGPPTGPTPVMTAPSGEPVNNWLEWFAAHFGMILGGGVEIGKIFMWLCFTVPVGVYVGKEAKAGAAGFMAGAGIVTLFFVLIGWVPIWLVVLLALIIGLLYAKVFNTQDNGGGR
ncbi:MAG: hypothetical protein WAO24_01090 [Peptococcia bacterium]